MRLNKWSIAASHNTARIFAGLRRHRQLHTDFGFMALFDYE